MILCLYKLLTQPVLPWSAALGLGPVPMLVKSTPFGFHGHLAGTLPVRESVFPTLPAQKLIFTAMANALRIAGGIAGAVA